MQSSLEDYEQRIEDKNVDKARTQIYFVGKDKKVNGKWSMSRGRGNYHNNSRRESQNSNNSKFQKGESIDNKGSGSRNYKGGSSRGRWKSDKRNIQCYNCQKLGYFAPECHANENDRQEAEAKFARQEDDESTLLKVIVEAENSAKNAPKVWYNRLKT